MANISKVDRKRERERKQATRNRQEIVAAQLSRRDLMKMGLLTSAGMLIPMKGLSARARDPRGIVPLDDPVSPPTTPFVDPLPIPPIKQPVSSLSPAPQAAPNTAAGEGRTRAHQAFAQFPPEVLYEVRQQAFQSSPSPDLPVQTLWGFDGMSPGPTYVNRYGDSVLVRNWNELPPQSQNGGFGKPSVSTHLHNGHTPSESDGFPCDYFERGQFYDQHYPNVLAGFASTHAPNGDLSESLSTLWYHDHRVDFTAQNVYKGLAGFYLLFNDHDTGDEGTGFHLPSFPEYDIPMIFTDRVFDEDTGLLFFDLFNLDGILGDKYLVNGKIQPVLTVKPRRYRFRWLDGGPSRFYRLAIFNPQNSSQPVPFYQISNDGNLLPKPIQVTSVFLSVAERADVIVDFAPFAGKTLYLVNRQEQDDGRGPDDDDLFSLSGSPKLVKIIVEGGPVTDNSADPATITQFYALPDKTATPRITRTFRFERTNGQWAINQKFFNCDEVRFRIKRNSVERWIIQNNSGGWQHPVHIHFEEFQILKRNGVVPGTNSVERSRKDVLRLGHNEEVELFFRFRDFSGRYPMHCHNTLHEDHAMMIRWDIDDTGDNKTQP